MKKLIIILLLIFSPSITFAQTESQKTEEYFQAKIIEVLEQKETVLSDGTKTEQQVLKLHGLDGNYIGKDFVFDGTGDYDVLKKNLYKAGEKVLVVASTDDKGAVSYYITDYVRTNSLLYLAILFLFIMILVGGLKGVRAILSLVLTFLIIIKFLLPQILAGANPVLYTIISSFFILLIIIYFTEGIKKSSHIAVFSILLSLILSVILSWLFVEITKLSGFNSEELAYLTNIGGNVINFKGLLLAGIIIGTLGVLDDVVIAQIASVEQLILADPQQDKKTLFKNSYKIGISHISSMANTLFLAYAGASMSLLILFASGESAFSSWTQAINNEAIATEIVRTLTGSIGLILAVPISTGLAVWVFSRDNK